MKIGLFRFFETVPYLDFDPKKDLKKVCLEKYLPFMNPWAVVYYSLEAAEILAYVSGRWPV